MLKEKKKTRKNNHHGDREGGKDEDVMLVWMCAPYNLDLYYKNSQYKIGNAPEYY